MAANKPKPQQPTPPQRMSLAEVMNSALKQMPEHERLQFMEQALDGLCSKCYGNIPEGSSCWCDYVSPWD